MISGMPYPTLEQVTNAGQLQLAKWMRFLGSPQTDKQMHVLDAIQAKFKANGGWTPELSKLVGWVPDGDGGSFKRGRWADGP